MEERVLSSRDSLREFNLANCGIDSKKGGEVGVKQATSCARVNDGLESLGTRRTWAW